MPRAIDGEPRVRDAVWRGFLFGLATNVMALRFVPEVIARFTPLPKALGFLALFLLAAMQAVPWLVGAAAARGLMRWRCSNTPPVIAFGICVYVATFVPAVFPWTPAGGLAHWPVLLQTAELVGERGTSLVLAVACALAAETILRARSGEAERRQIVRPAAISAAILIALVAYGALRMSAIEHARDAAPHARVALLEPDFDPVFHWEAKRADAMLSRLSAMTKRAEEAGAILTIWPESAYPYTLPHGTTWSPRGARAVLQEGVHGPVLTGVYMSKTNKLGSNSAVLVMPGGEMSPSYDKRHLLWFGETVPLSDVFPVLRRIFARGIGLEPGTKSLRFVTGPINAAVLNCYEDTIAVAGREAMEVHPNLLVNVTNDAWFSGSAESELHLRLAVLRSIETRRDLVRAVNRGPTSWVDAGGRIRARQDSTPHLGPSPPLVVDAALLDLPLTPYARLGDLPLVALLAATSLLRAFARTRPRPM